MRKVVLVKLYDDSNDGWYNEWRFKDATDAFMLSEEDFQYYQKNMHKVPGQHKYEDNFRYQLVEILPPEKLVDLKIHIEAFFAAEKQRQEDAARKREENKRKKAEKELETKRKQLEKLKKELGEK